MSQSDFISAIRQIAAERKIEVDSIINAIKEAVASSFRVEYGFEEKDKLTVSVDPDHGSINVYAEKEVTDTVTNDKFEISTADAKKLNAKVKVGNKLLVDITPKGDFGRIAAQTARQIILQKLREAEKDSVIKSISGRIGDIVTVVVQKITQEGDVICEINRAKAVMPKAERVPTEFYRLGSNIKVLLKSIEDDGTGNKSIVISRSDSDFLRALFKMEVPEIESGSVEIVSIAREAGSRSKVAVKSNASGVDPIGSCVGQKGVRINAISNELKNGNFEEKVDIILWDENLDTYLMNSIRPAESVKVEIVNEKEQKAIIVVPDAQLSLAIGRDGQNVRLSAKLTGWSIDIEGDEEGKVVETSEDAETEVGEPAAEVIAEEKAEDVTEKDAVKEVKPKKAKAVKKITEKKVTKKTTKKAE
ncbi:MAG: transcription termination factor NusA [Candidatus Dojkabacteria bacterium]